MYKKKRNTVLKVFLCLFGSAALSFVGFVSAVYFYGDEKKATELELVKCRQYISELQSEIAELTEPVADSRQVYIDSVELHDFVYTGDHVDIRSVDENGIDNLVLANLEVVSVGDKGFILSMTESEIKNLTFSTSMLQNGALLRQYAVRYPE